MKLEELQKLVIEWAEERGLLTDVTPERTEKQTLKVLEEIGETAGAYLKGNREELIDGIGDVAVTLIILAAMNKSELEFIDSAFYMESDSLIHVAEYLTDFHNGSDEDSLSYAYDVLHKFSQSRGLYLVDCLLSAYNVISKRTGKMVNGTFIKD